MERNLHKIVTAKADSSQNSLHACKWKSVGPNINRFSLAARGPYGGWVSPHLVVTHSRPAGGLAETWPDAGRALSDANCLGLDWRGVGRCWEKFPGHPL